MSFAAPTFLVALLLVPLALLWYARTERRAGRSRDAFALPAVRPSVAPVSAGWRRHVPAALLALALSVLALALARPQATVAVPVEQATVMMVLDRSGSMLATDVQPNRLVAARTAAQSFLDEVPAKMRVGLVTYNQQARVVQTPTREHDLVAQALAETKAAGSTATGDALDLAVRVAQTTKTPQQPGVEKPKKPPAAIILLSDGKSVRGDVDPLGAAQKAREAGIKVYTIALGTPDGTIQVKRRGGGTRPEPVPPDPATLRRIAETTGGTTLRTSDVGKLSRFYGDLGSQVAKEKQKREVTGMFAGGALLLLVSAAAASLRWFGRVL